MNKLIDLTIDGEAAVLTLNKPDDMNPIDDDVTAEMLDAIDEVKSNSKIRALILTGAGKAFSAGGNLEMLGVMANRAKQQDYVDELETKMRNDARVVLKLHNLEILTIAAINGPCVSAAMGWVGACDMRLASKNASFNTAFMELGVSTDFGTTRFLKEIVGKAIATDWILRPRKISAETALAAGFVTHLVNEADLLSTALEWTKVSQRYPVGTRSSLGNLREPTDLPLQDALNNEAKRFAVSFVAQEATDRVLNIVQSFQHRKNTARKG